MKTFFKVLGIILGLAFLTVIGLIMFKVIAVPEWLWWLIVIKS